MNNGGRRRVVVTGVGMITPLGATVEKTWEGIRAGRSGIGRITRFDTTGLETTIAGEVRDFDPTQYLDRKEVRRADRFAQMAVASAGQALKDAKLEINPDNAPRIGVAFGSGIGGVSTLVDNVLSHAKDPKKVSAFLIPMMIVDMAAGEIAMKYGAKGPNMAHVSACASSAHAIGEATEQVRRGQADVMLAGGAEAGIIRISIAAFNQARALSTRNDAPEQASRPFDRDRDGFVFSEAAGCVVLEAYEHAKARGAPILAEIIGYGATADAHHVTAPAEGGEGIVRAMRMALDDAALAPSDVAYVNAHGTSTQANDSAETAAIKTVFGPRAYSVAVSSTKSMTGHTLGAAGAIEAIFCVLGMRDGVLPPTINLENPDPDCDLDYVPKTSRKAKFDIAMSNSMGFGGHNASLLFRSGASL
ncbi:MAG: beta-ketoacyl-ACP synthase II [Chloroflexi bacterium]|nr:MAG: beta-ketoacyl-ACP synthase II [Chloroflexota bacterium]TMB94868.1 MAG: beta-ketoacyl-ACP synthase II [Chloroflexota bacterium]TMC27264.1 MAG: beta-ketoacyl-ACP synthase II [Chloroflexota bacterium]TMC34115.1 MAG: beta-ketoacyl-ACP synthase II [Chloroflexota bacterium]TMC57845.1 MAG: beta-ketoacyl-ACP synthase II [Chloroflexota bacterium]